MKILLLTSFYFLVLFQARNVIWYYTPQIYFYIESYILFVKRWPLHLLHDFQDSGKKKSAKTKIVIFSLSQKRDHWDSHCQQTPHKDQLMNHLPLEIIPVQASVF